MYYVILQTCIGIFLKTHIWQESRFRRWVVIVHGVIGKSFPVVGWTQMLFGGIAAQGFCFGEHFVQCLAHFLMGSAFIGYAMILLIMLRVGAGFLARKEVSQEFLDSAVIMTWGVINTFTEHDFMQKSSHWSHRDMQHVSLGVLWWAGGALGLFLSRKGKRSVVPAIIIAMTGYAMSAHVQNLEYSLMIHKVFGYSLVAAGLTRIVEICFILRDAPTPPGDSTPGPSSFQHIPLFLLVLAGLAFLSATEEQIAWVSDGGMDHVTYTIILFSGAFLIYLDGAVVLEIYEYCARKTVTPKGDLERGRTWYGVPLPSGNPFRSFFPGMGVRLGGSQGERATAEYEAIPLSRAGGYSAPRKTNGGPVAANDRVTVFDVGDDEDDEYENGVPPNYIARR